METPEQSIVQSLDEARENVNDALGEFYTLVRKDEIDHFEHAQTGEQLRCILRELTEVANRFDK